MTKYFQPRSLTWWASFVPLIGGIVVAMDDVFPTLMPFSKVILELAGDMTAAQLVQLGLLGIGIRGAIAK